MQWEKDFSKLSTDIVTFIVRFRNKTCSFLDVLEVESGRDRGWVTLNIPEWRMRRGRCEDGVLETYTKKETDLTKLLSINSNVWVFRNECSVKESLQKRPVIVGQRKLEGKDQIKKKYRE